MFPGEVLKYFVKRLAVPCADHSGRVGRLNDIRITVADDNLSAHQIDNLVEQTGLKNPKWNLKASRREATGCFEVGEADRGLKRFETLQHSCLLSLCACASSGENAGTPG